jgi:hypothetical protein
MATVLRLRHIVEIRCDSAGEFIEVLNPLSGVFAFGGAENYIYRGVRSEKFDLIPSAFRAQSELLFMGRYVRPPLNLVVQQCAAELATLRRFVEIAARQGVRLPEDSITLRTELERWEELLADEAIGTGAPVEWPPSMFYSLIALAQHYQVPTRALDWSASALTAAYFAATTADPGCDDHLAVWVFSRATERFDRFLARRESATNERRPLILFTTAGADNDNLRAQRGLFMIYSQAVERHDQVFLPIKYDDLLLSSLPMIGDAAVIYKVTVQAHAAPVVVAALASAGVTAAALFPGLWGAARQFHEEKAIAHVSTFLPKTGEARRIADLLVEWNIPPGG